MKSFLENDELEVFTANSSREALELINNNKEENINLILIDTFIPSINKPAFFSLKPTSKMNIDTTKQENYLYKPFTKEELICFVKNKI
jgi:CheY-like chemotaxis protein